MTVGSIEGGQASNVIPEYVKFKGTYRSLTSEGLSYLQERIKEVRYIITHFRPLLLRKAIHDYDSHDFNPIMAAVFRLNWHLIIVIFSILL